MPAEWPEATVLREVSGGSATHLLTLMSMREVVDPEHGPCLQMDLRPEVANPHGSLHGGLMTTLIECGAAGCAVRATGSEQIVAADLSVRFLTVVRTGPARVLTRVLRAGGRSVVVQADVIDVGSDRALVATATLSYARLDPGANLPPPTPPAGGPDGAGPPRGVSDP